MPGTGSSLPAAARSQFTAGMMGPGYPIDPFPLDDPLRNGITEPRLTEYLPGWNYPMIPGMGKLLPFGVLRALGDLILPARKAIDIRKQELSSLPWDIVLRPQFHREAQNTELMEVREKLIQFFHYPDPYEDLTFSQWIQMAQEEIDVVDALSIYLRPTLNPHGGVLNSGLGSLNILDGTTVKPLRDARGGRPIYPAPAFQQFLYGAPRTDLFAPENDEENPEDIVKTFNSNELIYRPFVRRSWTPYGFSSLEAAIQEIKLWIDREKYHQSFFDSSDMPAMFLQVPREWSPTQIEEYERSFNRRLAGDPAWRWRVRMIPQGTGTGSSTVIPVKQIQYAMDFDEHLIRMIAMAFDVTAEELGVQPKGGLGGRGWAEESGERMIRLSLQPRLIYFAELFNFVIRHRLGVEEFVFQWIDTADSDRDIAFADAQYVNAGIKTRAEVREERGLDALDSPGENELMITTAQGAVPLAQIANYGRLMNTQTGEMTDTTENGQRNNSIAPTKPIMNQGKGNESGGNPIDGKADPEVNAVKVAQIHELDQWERMLRGRGVLTRPFRSNYLPNEFVEKVATLTNYLDHESDVNEWRHEVFKLARRVVEEADSSESLISYPLMSEISMKLTNSERK